MRIGIACFPTSGGSGVVATELGHALAARGHEVHLVSPAPPFRARAGAATDGVRFHRVSIPDYPLREYPSYGMAVACALADLVERRRLDVLHAHYAFPHALAGFLAREAAQGARPALVATLHGTDITLADRHPCHARLVSFALDRCDAVTAVSEYLRAETLRRFRPAHDVAVIPNFVDARTFAPLAPAVRAAVRRRLGVPARARAAGTPAPALLVHVSNFRPVKRVPDLLRAFARIRRRIPAVLVLAGAGEDAPAARALARRLGIAPHVRFVGEVRRIERLLGAADLFLLASEMEGFGLSVLEAMSCGVPVVATRCGGPQELIEDGVEGRLAPVGRPADFARATLDLLEAAPAERRARCESARARALRFSPEAAAGAYERVYRAAAERARRGSTAAVAPLRLAAGGRR
ncbi:MAG: N-acetyl-alpha-D-glucosaminyl L-malate synthase BshA [Planctomycetes bacterium]|nr:N-acetyl-alpha-D-glucosaminyl L-malate synthase BshA [Planctomycetota bacterium]